MAKVKKAQDRTLREAITHFFVSVRQIGGIAYKAAPRLLIGTTVLRVLQALMPVASAYVFALIFDSLGAVLQDDTSIAFQADVLPLILLFGALIIISQSLGALDVYMNEELGRRLQLHMGKVVYGHLLTLQGISYYENPAFHDKFQQVTNQLGWLPQAFIRETSGLIGNILTLISFFGIVFVFSPVLALLLIIATIPTFWAQLRFRRKRFDMSWNNSPIERKAWYFSSLLSQNQYAKETRLFNLGDYILKRYVTATEQVFIARRELNQEELKINTGLNVLSAVVTVGTYIYVIGQAFAQIITLGSVTLYVEAVRNVQQQLRGLAWATVAVSERTLFFSHFQDLMALESTLEQYEPAQDAPPLQNKIELKNVAFRYTPDGDDVLKNINLTIHKDESLALVGVNGAGKTTIVKLLARFYDPTDGAILWDGVDIRHYTPQSLRARLGAVMQDFIRYDMSARENIGMGDVVYIDDMLRIREAAQEVGVDDFISDLPQGYDTILSRWLVIENEDEGTDLSGGQWQKIAISRTYLRDTDLMMLDEPTSALDAEAEHDIYERFAELSAGRATILISHRFSTVRMADKIAVLEDGEIIEYGAHHNLIEQNGTYARLYGLQAKQYVS